jgi:hypothetical protein
VLDFQLRAAEPLGAEEMAFTIHIDSQQPDVTAVVDQLHSRFRRCGG